MKQIKEFLRRYKWYRWCEANDLKAHYYVAQYIAFLSATISLFVNDNIITSAVIGAIASSLLIVLKELLDDTGFNKTDIKNGLIGASVGLIKYSVLAIIKIAIEQAI